MRSIGGFLQNRRCASLEDALKECFTKKHCSPGLWAALAVLCREEGWNPLYLIDFLRENDQLDYGRAIGIEEALGLQDTYRRKRVNRGANYSPLAVLDAEERTNEATRDVAGCIRTWFGGGDLEPFAAALCDVVGDLHDNVWSHAKSTGISMAQKWSGNDGDFLDFALADGGLGFVRELTRSGVLQREGIRNAAEAIGWCIVKGHSSKIKAEDPWAQRLPEDAMGNPIGAIARIVSKENNHLGLGLAKLVDLVTKYRGNLWLATDSAMLTIGPKGDRNYLELPFRWTGVLLSCRFNVAVVQQVVAEQRKVADEIDDMIGALLKG